MPDREAIERGLAWERETARRIGARPQPGSGNHFTARLDIAKYSFLLSLKDTAGEKFYLRPGLIEEMVNACVDPGGAGVLTIPLLVPRVGDYELAVLRLDDLLHIVTEDVKIRPASKLDEKRATAAIPPALRGES